MDGGYCAHCNLTTLMPPLCKNKQSLWPACENIIKQKRKHFMSNPVCSHAFSSIH